MKNNFLTKILVLIVFANSVESFEEGFDFQELMNFIENLTPPAHGFCGCPSKDQAKNLEDTKEEFERLKTRYENVTDRAVILHRSVELKQEHAENAEEQSQETYTNCYDATNKSKQNGLYQMQLVDGENQRFYAPCIYSRVKYVHDDQDCLIFCRFDGDFFDFGGGWLVIMRRQNGHEDFNQDWLNYKAGFGLLKGEFFIGLENLYQLTKNSSQELLVILDSSYYARYDMFAIDDEQSNYTLSLLGNYSGNATDQLREFSGMDFSTKDKDQSKNNCATQQKSGWWFRDCAKVNLFGEYKQGIKWVENHKIVEMMIRPIHGPDALTSLKWVEYRIHCNSNHCRLKTKIEN